MPLRAGKGEVPKVKISGSSSTTREKEGSCGMRNCTTTLTSLLALCVNKGKVKSASTWMLTSLAKGRPSEGVWLVGWERQVGDND